MTDAQAGLVDPAGDRVLRVVGDLGSLISTGSARAGALWRLTESGRQLDASVVRVPPNRRIDTHIEPDLDVFLLVVDGDGTLDAAPGPQPLTCGSLVWLPHGSARSLTAGRGGMSYLTVHRRRPGMQIQPRPGG